MLQAADEIETRLHSKG